jgi:sulfate/thiosulfate transport system ATP-binding protein
VLLLDEPFGALDAKVRKELRRWLRRLHDEVHVTSVFVTHDQEEAMEVADRVVVLNQGRIEQVGTPDEVYDRPASPFVLQFLGDVNLFHGRVGHHADASGQDVSYVRPHELEIVNQAADDTWPVTLAQTLTVGPNTRLEFKREGVEGTVDVELPREAYVELRQRLSLQTGSQVHLRPRRITRFAAAATLSAAVLSAGLTTPADDSNVKTAGLTVDQRLLDHWAG